MALNIVATVISYIYEPCGNNITGILTMRAPRIFLLGTFEDLGWITNDIALSPQSRLLIGK